MNKPPHKAATGCSRTGPGVTPKALNASPSMQPGTAEEERIRREQAKKLQEQASLPQALQRADASSTRPAARDLQRARSDGGGEGTSRAVPSRQPPHPIGKPTKSDPVTIRCTTTPIDAPYAMTTSKAGSSANGSTGGQSGKASSSSSSSRPVAAHCKSASFGSSSSKGSSTSSRRDGPEWTAVKSTITPIIPPSSKTKLTPAPTSYSSSSQSRVPDSSLSTSSLHKASQPSSSLSTPALHAQSNGQSAKPAASSSHQSSGTSSSLRSPQAIAERMRKEKEAHQRLVDTLARITEAARNRKPFTCEDASRSCFVQAAGQAEAAAQASTPQASPSKTQSSGSANIKAPSARGPQDTPLRSSATGVKSTPPPAALTIAQRKPATPPAAQAQVPALPDLKPRSATATTVNAKVTASTQATASNPKADKPKGSTTSASTAVAPPSPKEKSNAGTTTQTGVVSKATSVPKAIAVQTEPTATRSTRDVGASTFSPLPSPRLPKASESHGSRTTSKRPEASSTTPPKLDAVTPSSGYREASHARAERKPQQPVEALKLKTGTAPPPPADAVSATKTHETKPSRAVEKPKFVSAFLTRPLQPKAPESQAPGPLQNLKESRAKDPSASASPRKSDDCAAAVPKTTTPHEREEKPKRSNAPPSPKATPHKEVEMRKAQKVTTLTSEASTHSVSTKSSYHDPRERSHHHSSSTASYYPPPVQAEARTRLNTLKKEDARPTSAASTSSAYTTCSSSSEDTIARFIRAFPPVPTTPTFPTDATPHVGAASLRQPSAAQSRVHYDAGKSKPPSTATRRPSTADAHHLPSMFTMSIASDSGSATSTIRRPSTSDATCSPPAMSMREVTRHHARISKADTVLSAAASIGEARTPLPDTASDVVSYASFNPVSTSVSRSKGSRTGKMSKSSSAASSEAATVKGDASHSEAARVAPSASLRPTASPSSSKDKTASSRAVNRSSAEGKAAPLKGDAPASATRVAPPSTSASPSHKSPLSVPPRTSSAIAAESIRKLEERIAKLEALSANRAMTKSSMKARAELVSCRLGDSFAVVDVEEVIEVDENGAGPSRLPAGKAVRFNVNFPNRSESTLSTDPAEAESSGASSSSATPVLRTNRPEEAADGPPRYSSLSPLKDDFTGSSTSLPARERRRRSRSDATEQLRHVNSVPFLYRSGERVQKFNKDIVNHEPLFGNEFASRSLTWLPMKSSQSLPMMEDKERAGKSKAKKLWTKAKNGLGLGGKKEGPRIPPLDTILPPKQEPPERRLPASAQWPTEKKRHINW